MRQLNFAAHPNFSHQMREVKRLFGDSFREPMLKGIREFLEQVMHEEILNRVDADWHERAPRQRRDFRNGCYVRSLVTSMGEIRLSVPRTRQSGSAAGIVVEAYQRRTAEVDSMLQQVFLRGVSTRQTGAVLEALCGHSLSATSVSRLTRSLEEQARRFHIRELQDRYRYLLLDGVYLRVRQADGVKRRVVLCAYGIAANGERELIDFQLARSEGQRAWEGFLNSLFQRGLIGKELQLITTDGGLGLHAALEVIYPRVALQRCWAHKIRNLTDKMPRALLSQCRRGLRPIYDAVDRAAALAAFRRWEARWKGRAPKVVRCLKADLDQLLACYACPIEHRIKVRTTNVIERCFREVRRRVRPMTLFQNPASCDRIIFAIFSRLNTEWMRHPLPEFTQKA